MINQPSYLLAIETATEVCSVALFRDNQLIAEKEKGGTFTHAENLAPFVEDLIKQEELSFSLLNAIAVSKGPGSYTGLRIGVAFAKGLCFALNIPLIAIDTLEAMAWGAIQEANGEKGYYCPMLDARRIEVYTSVYDETLKIFEPNAAIILDEGLYEAYYREAPFFIFGNGSNKALAYMNHEQVKHLNCLPSAKNIGELAFKKYEKREFEDLAYFEPYYLKEYIAAKSKKLV